MGSSVVLWLNTEVCVNEVLFLFQTSHYIFSPWFLISTEIKHSGIQSHPHTLNTVCRCKLRDFFVQSQRFWLWYTLPVHHTRKRMRWSWAELWSKPRPAQSSRGNQNKLTSGKPQPLNFAAVSAPLSVSICFPCCLSSCRVVCQSPLRQASVKASAHLRQEQKKLGENIIKGAISCL